MEIAKIKKWVEKHSDLKLKSLDSKIIDDILSKKGDLLPYKIRRVLEIRSMLGSASVKKIYAMVHQVAPDNPFHPPARPDIADECLF